MPIDRTWFNNLVDDDGSGLVGTIWNKAAIKGLLDSIDGMFQTGTWVPTLVGTSGGTATYSLQAGMYTRADKNVSLMGHIVCTSKGSLSGSIVIGYLPFATANGSADGSISIGHYNGVAVPATALGTYLPANGQNLAYIMWASGSGGSGGGGASQFLDAGHLGAGTIDLIFGGSYVCL